MRSPDCTVCGQPEGAPPPYPGVTPKKPVLLPSPLDLVTRRAPKYEGSLVTVDGLEEGMMEPQMPKSLHDILPQAFKDRYVVLEEGIS